MEERRVRIKNSKRFDEGRHRDVQETRSGQKENKRLTVAAATEMDVLKERCEEVIIKMGELNLRLDGKLEENRRQLLELMELGMKFGRVEREEGKEREAETDNEGQGMEVEEGRTPPKRKKGKKKKRKTPGSTEDREVPGEKTGPKPGGSNDAERGGQEKRTVVKGKEGGDFVLVASKRSQKQVEGRKKEAWRAKEPVRSFVVQVGEEGAEATKKTLWSAIVGRVGAPQMSKTSVLARGDIRVVPGDESTARALRELESEGKVGVREARQRWPKVIVFDMEREVKAEDIPAAIARQNPRLGIEEGKEGEAIKPIFQRGGKEDRLTHWVCEVSPELYGKIEGTFVFVGYGRCRVAEWIDVIQCNKCQGFGHMEKKCFRKEEVCGHCAKRGHRASGCKDRDRKPRCFNCGLDFSARHKGCRIRERVARATMVGTFYGTK